MSIAMNAFRHDIKNIAFNHIKSEPILFVADKVLQMTNMVDKSVKMHSPLTL